MSNSSSSSFCIVGKCYDYNELAKEFDLDCEDWSDAEYKVQDFLDLNLPEDLTYRDGIDNYDGVVIGINIREMGADETRTQFSNRITGLLRDWHDKNIKDTDVSICIDGGRVG